jgi:DNA-binding IclR family transcriptional regulator
MAIAKRERVKPAPARGRAPESRLDIGREAHSLVPPDQKIDSAVKSAKRVFNVLEFFDEHQSSASAVDVATALQLPQSSTSALMRTMTALGYLHYDTGRRTYIPTARVSMLGHWISPVLFRRGRLINLMEDLSSKTGETVMVGLRNGLAAQYIHVIQAKIPMRLHVRSGTLRPLAKSGLGYSLLSSYPNKEVRRLVKLLNSCEMESGRKVDIKPLLVELDKVREQGHALSLSLVTPGAGVVAMTLPPLSESSEPLAICVAGLTNALIAQETEFAALMHDAIKFHLSD